MTIQRYAIQPDYLPSKTGKMVLYEDHCAVIDLLNKEIVNTQETLLAENRELRAKIKQQNNELMAAAQRIEVSNAK